MLGECGECVDEHHPETTTPQEAPTLGVDRVLSESENVHVVTSRHLKITDCQYAAGVDNLSHAFIVSDFPFSTSGHLHLRHTHDRECTASDTELLPGRRTVGHSDIVY